MKALKYFLSICLIASSIISCDNTNKGMGQENQKAFPVFRAPALDEVTPRYDEDDEIILGEQRNNPYEIGNMRNAYDLLQDYRQNFLVGDTIPTINRIYYRVLPLNSTDLALLAADTSVIYFDYPLDYDIVRLGSYYHDPTVSDSIYTWMYAVVPVNHPLPNLSTLQVLQECYIPEEPIENSNYDAIPDWQNGFAMLEYMAYKISGNLDMYDSDAAAIYEEILLETSQARLGNSRIDNDANVRSWFWDTIIGVYPKGNFYVENSITNNLEGIKNASVFIHNFIKFYCGPLDSQGYYESSTRFRTRCWYHIRFANHHTGTRIFGGAKFLLGPVHRRLGWHSRYGHDDTLFYDDVAWRYASINNAVEQYYNYCQEYNIIFPYNVNVWVLSGIDNWSGSTPLFHKRGSALIYNPLLFPLWIFLEIPDMALFMTQGDVEYKTAGVYETIFHEFSHASHYEKVGDNYWRNYVLHIMVHSGYGSDASGLYHGYCGIGEMWGYFAGHHFLYKYLGCNYPYIFIDTNDSLNTSMYIGLVSHPAFWPHRPWFKPGILAKIHQESQCSITTIYNALNADVYSLDGLKTSLQLQGLDASLIQSVYDRYSSWSLQE